MNSLQLVQKVSLIYIMLVIIDFITALSLKMSPCRSLGLDQRNYWVGERYQLLKKIKFFKLIQEIPEIRFLM